MFRNTTTPAEDTRIATLYDELGENTIPQLQCIAKNFGLRVPVRVLKLDLINMIYRGLVHDRYTPESHQIRTPTFTGRLTLAPCPHRPGYMHGTLRRGCMRPDLPIVLSNNLYRKHRRHISLPGSYVKISGHFFTTDEIDAHGHKLPDGFFVHELMAASKKEIYADGSDQLQVQRSRPQHA